jgi:deoxyribodipyrimidine photolyase
MPTLPTPVFITRLISMPCKCLPDRFHQRSYRLFSTRRAPLEKILDHKIPVRLRAIRKIVEETKNHDLERDLYIEERKAERGVYWHTQVDELKRAPDELNKQLEDINKQFQLFPSNPNAAFTRCE